jgi:predicted nucleic acid-binding protein
MVIDASVTIAAVGDEVHTARAREILGMVARDGAVVPGSWPIEVANILLMMERRALIDSDTRIRIAGQLEALPITIDPDTAGRALGRISELAARHRLSVYDGCYLELSLRLGEQLATFDTTLTRAAKEAGVEVI